MYGLSKHTHRHRHTHETQNKEPEKENKTKQNKTRLHFNGSPSFPARMYICFSPSTSFFIYSVCDGSGSSAIQAVASKPISA